MPSIYEKLRAKLGRDPTDPELFAAIEHWEEGEIERIQNRGLGRRRVSKAVRKDPHAKERAKAVKAYKVAVRRGLLKRDAKSERITPEELNAAIRRPQASNRSSATDVKIIGLAPRDSRCDCEHSRSLEHGHQAGNCRRPADVIVTAYGMKQGLCTKCAEAS